MATSEISIEYKNQDITPEIVTAVFGKVIRRRPQVTEIIIVCRSASSAAFEAARDLTRNSEKLITLAPNL